MKLINKPHPKDLKNLVDKYWKQDSTVMHYTGQMFGICCRLSSQAAISRINQYKQRAEKTGYIVLISDLQWLYDHEIEVPASLHTILLQFWPGNLTVVFPTRNERFKHIAVNGKVAFRVPSDHMLRQIIDDLDEPIISTSINVSGVPPAKDLQDIRKRYDNWFDLGFVPQKTDLFEPSTIVEYIDSDDSGKPVLPYLKCLRESTVPFYNIKQSFQEPTVLFVCTGNICRSPIAEYLFNYYSSKKKLHYKAKSAGLMGDGAMISLNSMQLLAEQSIMAQEHSSRKINPEILSGSWLILTMEERQRDIIRANFHEFEDKIFTLNEYVGEAGDIADPIGEELDYYRNIYNQIDAAVLKLFAMLEKKI